MWKNWSFVKRFGGPLLRLVKRGVPLLLTLGLVFLLVGIWWLGPQWTWRGQTPLVSLTARVLATVVLLTVPILGWALLLRHRNRRLEADRERVENRKKDLCLCHIQAQERALDRSLATLRANLKGRNALYQLPWYLVLGQEDAGKTSFINRSSQSFSLTGEIKAGSERMLDDPDLAYAIDWWMGDEAVLIDPPGELISQPREVPGERRDGTTGAQSGEITGEKPKEGVEGQPEAAEGQASQKQLSGEASEPDGAAPAQGRPAAAQAGAGKAKSGRKEISLPAGAHARLWESLIDWLGRNRSRRPLNGVVLIVDLVTLLGQQPSDRKALAILLRTRLAELSRRLGTRPPLYVVLTKFDLVDGFEAFFSRLPRSVREEIFGFTFTLDSVQNYDAWLTELAGRYDDLVARLNERVFDALGAVASLQEREGLLSLVRQLIGMREILLGFLADILGSDRYITPALPRGVYFSSVYQQGLMTNAFVSSASQAYAVREPVPHAQPSGRATVYFAQQLFQQVIYPEAGLAGDNLKVLADKKRALALSAGVASVVSLLVAGGWFHYYGINRDKAMAVLERSRAFSAKAIDGQTDATGRNLLQPLDQIHSAVAVYGSYRDAWPVIADMGLYQGRRIGPKVDEAYLKLLSQRFLPALAGGVMASMTAPNVSGEDQLAALRVYRMIEDRRNRRAPIVEDWMGKRWRAAFPGQSGVQAALMGHLDYALKYADADLPQYRERVADLQRELRQIPLPQRIYMTMRLQAGETLRAPLDLRNEIGPAFDVVYKSEGNDAQGGSSKVDALLTARGYEGFFEPHSRDLADLAMIDQWALGERRDIDYSEADKQALAERVRALYSRDYIDTWQRGISQLDVRDFGDIAQAVSVLGSITSPAAPMRRLVETVRDNSELGGKPVANAADKATGNTTGKTAPASAVEPDAPPSQMDSIARAFVPLTDVLVARADKPSYLDETMLAIGNVHDVVKAVQDSPDRGKAALSVVLDRFALKGPDSIGNLQRIAAGLPEPLDRQVRKLADESSQVLLIEALRELERRWDSEVFRFYSERLAGRYPFNPASREDASLDDFTAFFGPQGRLQQFKGQYLKLFLEDNLEALYSERRGGYLVRTDILDQLKSAERIRDAFFDSRGTLAVRFAVEPLGLTPTRRGSVLNVEGQLITYSHGPSSSSSLVWPNSQGDSNESRITLVNGAGNSSSLVYRGAWSLFHLLSQARLNGATVTSVDLSFAAVDGGMRYRITAEKTNNPFTQQLFRGFALPRTLLQDQVQLAATLPARPDAVRADRRASPIVRN